MAGKGIVHGQPVSRAKARMARGLRRRTTPEERQLWAELRRARHGGAHFRRQQIIVGYIADFYSNVSGLAIEVDGRVHETQSEEHLSRGRAFQELGIRVHRFSNDRIRNDLENVMREIDLATIPPTPMSPPSPDRRGAGGGVR